MTKAPSPPPPLLLPSPPTIVQLVICHCMIGWIQPFLYNPLFLIMDLILNQTSSLHYSSIGLSLLLMKAIKPSLASLPMNALMVLLLRKYNILPLADSIVFIPLLLNCLSSFKLINPLLHIDSIISWAYIIFLIVLPIILEKNTWTKGAGAGAVHINRKSFHFILVLMFNFFSDPSFILFSTTLMIVFCILLEIIKHYQVFLPEIPSYFLSSSDHGGSPMILSHIFLLIATITPLVIGDAHGAHGGVSSENWKVGLISVGILDSFTCIGGLLIPSPGIPFQLRKKTLSGFIFGSISWVMFWTIFHGEKDVGKFVMQGIILSLWETYCPINDNLTLPIIAYLLGKKINNKNF